MPLLAGSMNGRLRAIPWRRGRVASPLAGRHEVISQAERGSLMTKAEELADFAVGANFKDLSSQAVHQLKIRLLDSVGCAIAALGQGPTPVIRDHIREFCPQGNCTMIGGGQTSPDLAAFYNGALVRYLDFNDSYLAKGETCHPSDNVAPVLAAAEYSDADGKDFLAALAVAYQVQCRLSDVAPVRAAGFDHVVQGSYAVAAGISRAMRLNPNQTANAIAIAGTASNALRVTRTGKLSHWKALAYPNMAAVVVRAALLARSGVTGPLEVFEGNKGFMDAIVGKFEINWKRENLERVTRTILKKYNAEIHSQSAIEAALSLKNENQIPVQTIERADLDIFDVAYNIIGGGEEGDKKQVETKEQADHSLPYLIAAALLDGKVMPEQYAAGRIGRSDVQRLLRKVFVTPNAEYSAQFPTRMRCRLTLTLKDGSVFSREQEDFPGFLTRPMSWQEAAGKFTALCAPFATNELIKAVADHITACENRKPGDLPSLLCQAKPRDSAGQAGAKRRQAGG